MRETAFWDDNLTLNKLRMGKICDDMIGRGIKIRWTTPNGVEITGLDEQTINKMRRSGCYKLTFCIETASPNTQKFTRKEYIDLKRAKEIIRYCNTIGIWTHCAFIIGFPYETESDIMKTVDYAVACDADMVTFFVACPYPGTELYDIYRKEGLIPDRYDGEYASWNLTCNWPVLSTRFLDAEQIKRYLSLAKRKVYINRAISLIPSSRLIHKMRSRDALRFVAKQLFHYSQRLCRCLAE